MSLELRRNVMPFDSVSELFFRRASQTPDHVAYRYFERPTRQRDVSFREFSTQVRLFARGLQAVGLSGGARVAVVAEQGPEWTIADLGILASGCVAVALPSGLGADALREILVALEVRLLVCGCRTDAEAASAIKTSLPSLERVVGFGGAASVDAVLPFGDLMSMGREAEDGRSSRPPSSRGQKRPTPAVSIAADQLALLLHRDGQFVRFTHGQLVQLSGCLSRALQLNVDDVALPVLPMHDVAEHVVGLYGRVTAGVTTSFMANTRVESCSALGEIVPRINPSLVILGPAELQHFAQCVDELGSSPAQRPAFDWARRVGLEAAQRRRNGVSMGMKLGAQVAVADSLIWAKARELLGRKVRAVVCWGVADESPAVEWLHASGLMVVTMRDLEIEPATLASFGLGGAVAQSQRAPLKPDAS